MLILLAKICTALIISLFLTVIIHEAGHAVAGILTGYRFVALSFLGIKLTRKYSRIKLSIETPGLKGYCIMNPRTMKQNPSALILGGMAANLVTGILILALTAYMIWHSDSGSGAGSNCITEILIAGLSAGLANLASVLLVIFDGDGTGDAANYREIKRDSANAEIFNRIQRIYREAEYGKKLREMDLKLFLMPEVKDSSLYDELLQYKYEVLRDE